MQVHALSGDGWPLQKFGVMFQSRIVRTEIVPSTVPPDAYKKPVTPTRNFEFENGVFLSIRDEQLDGASVVAIERIAETSSP